MKIIYIDILLITNFIVNISFLLLTKRISHAYSSKLRMVFAGIIGSFSAFSIIIDNNFTAFIIKTVFTVIQIMVCFETLKIKKIIKLAVIYISINISYVGAAFVFCKLFNRNLIYVKNMTVYFDIDMGMLILMTIIFYVMLTVREFLKNYSFDNNKSFVVRLKLSGREFEINGISDTGNLLVDCYYGKRVAVIASEKIFSELELDKENSIMLHKLHILPCSSISGNGIIYVTNPMKIEIDDEKNKYFPEVCVGICKNNEMKEKCIFNPKILL